VSQLTRTLSERIADAMLADQPRLRGRLRALTMRGDGRDGRPGRGPGRNGHGPGDPAERDLERLAQDIERSVARRRRRESSRPQPRFALDLPVLAKREEIASAIREHQVVVVCGETGSGKTTQLPQICLDLGRGVAGMIGHTQPRRIAARTVAARISEELGRPLGSTVGYKVRFGDQTGPDTMIKVMTDGILLAETQTDRNLWQYDTLIIDEAHERSLNIDFLLGYLKHLLPRRPDLKVIVTSATIDPQRFAKHFARGGVDAPIVEVSGRTYPVEVRYRPIVDHDPDDEERNQELAILDAVDELAREGGNGDILVFLSGEREIRNAAEALRKHHPEGTQILPLYARLSPAEQMRAFQPHPGRRIVLATNVAETSLTVPGIRYVVDTGKARISRYSARTKVQRLPIEPISQASADQRKGRCGRVAEGICIRLYSEEDFNQRPRFTEPEILRTNLASVILQMKALRLGAIEEFPFIEPPDGRMIRDGYETLQELGAIDAEGNLTEIGRRLAKLPIDPRVGRMLLAGAEEGVLEEVLVIASALSVQDPRDRPMDKQEQADQAHARFKSESSDFLTLLNLWRAYQDESRRLSRNKLRSWCHDHFLSFNRMREWEEVHHQLREMVGEMGLRQANRPAEAADAVHRALLSGLLSNVAQKGEGYEYQGARGTKVSIFPASALFKKSPKWIAAAEIVQTTRLYARTVAKVEPEWIERLAQHVVKRSYSDIHWQEETGQVCAFERVTLYGLVLAPRRRVHYGPIDPRAAREVFIHRALVEGDYRSKGAFQEHNRKVIEEVKRLEAKARRSDLLADAKAMYAFYDARIPEHVYSAGIFEKWRREAERENPRLLYMTPRDVMVKEVGDLSPELYPDHVPVGGSRLQLDYKLDPGEADDGVTLNVPLEALAQIDPVRCEWVVPGLVREKVHVLLKTLPKQYRTRLDPLAQTAEQVAAAMPYGRGPFLDALGEAVLKVRGVEVPRSAWQVRALPPHLSLNIRVLDDHGKEIAQGRDAAELQQRLAGRMRRALAGMARSEFGREGIREWNFGDLPETYEVVKNGAKVVCYPALVDRGSDVQLTLLESPEAAAAATRAGVRRLFIIEAAREMEHYLKGQPQVEKMVVLHAPIGRARDLRAMLVELIAEQTFLAGQPEVRTQAEFQVRLAQHWGRIGKVAREVINLAESIFTAKHGIDVRLAEKHPPAWGPAVTDMRQQLQGLFFKGFLGAVPMEHLREYPRYIAGMQTRLRKLANAGLQRDQRWMQELAPHWRRVVEVWTLLNQPDGAARVNPAEFSAYRWMVEEFRISLFAQELGTKTPVSAKRLEEKWAGVLRRV